MRIAISAQGPDMSSRVDPRFGRAAWFIVYDTDTSTFEVLENSESAGATQGAGIQTAQLVAHQSVDLVVSGNMGPKAFEALRAAGIKMVAWDNGTVAEAVELIRSGHFQALGTANARGHWR
jgi:predicted Fe-Mo cluster-binding NifX family protein